MTGGRLAYLIHLLAWGLPVLGFQLAALLLRDGRAGLAAARTVLPAVLGVTAWLVAADLLAFREGIWRLGDGQHLGWRVGALPVEEALFFLLSNALVAGGVLLCGGGRPR